MDNLSQTNRERWNALVRANVQYSRPFLELTPEQAREMVDNRGLLGDVTGKRVLCLAGGGGQQSIAFSLLGAKVAVFDLSDEQLNRDREVAAKLGISFDIVHGDMRDLSAFPDNAFDVVWQPYSINFVPSVKPVFAEVARVLSPDGLYYVHFANSFAMLVNDDAWDGKAYPVQYPYIDGFNINTLFPNWTVTAPNGMQQEIDGPQEYLHFLSTVVNTLISNNFRILGLWEELTQHPNPEPGTFEHFMSVCPPYLMIWAILEK
jgi:SAM-dependent methyltransferase